MIALESVSALQFAERTLPVAMESSVRCQAELELVVGSIMSAMEHYPFGASDGFAVQLAVSEALRFGIDQLSPSSPDEYVRVRTHVTSQFVRVQLEQVRETPDESAANASAELSNLEALNARGLSLMRTYMTSVEIRKQGRHVILYRARGQGSAISGPPIGYDFQI